MLKSGLYEQVINQHLRHELEQITGRSATIEGIDKAEAAKILAQYVSDVIEKSLSYVTDNGGDISQQVDFINKIIATIIEETSEPDFSKLTVDRKAEQLRALLDTVHTPGATGGNGMD